MMKKSNGAETFEKPIKLYAIIFIGIGVIIYLLCLIIGQFFPRDIYKWLGVGSDFFCNIGNIFIALGLGTIVLDFFEFIEYVKERLIDILIDNEYISDLSVDKQVKLKNRLEKHIYSYADLEEDGLLKFVQDEIHPLIKDYYYKEYITHVVCKLVDGKINKKIKRRIVIAKKCHEEINISVSTFFQSILKGTPDEARANIVLQSVIIDGVKMRVDVDDDLEYKLHHTINEGISLYRNSFSLHGNPITLKEEDVVIEIEIDTTVDLDDYLYIQRVQKPCRNFTIHFHFNNTEFMVNCDAFGFMTSSVSDRMIQTDLDNCVVVRFTNWILPGDGVAFNILKSSCFEE